MMHSRRLLAWYDRHGRDLPWRKTRDPYRILVSEIMLQQTQVSRVLDFYRRWLKRFPTWRALASSSNHDVIKAWSGLGYNRRALMLRDIARHVTTHGVPNTRDGWLALKGIGPYTADALAVFSLHERRWPIDTNLRRVGGRLLLGKPYPQPSDDDRVRKLATYDLRLTKRHFDVPQAAFDLATSICTKTPKCSICPLRNDCLAAPKFLSGTVRTPKRMGKKPIEKIHDGKRWPDRIYRGRILKLVMHARSPLQIKKLGPLVDHTFDPKVDLPWFRAMLMRMHNDELVKLKKDRVSSMTAS